MFSVKISYEFNEAHLWNNYNNKDFPRIPGKLSNLFTFIISWTQNSWPQVSTNYLHLFSPHRGCFAYGGRNVVFCEDDFFAQPESHSRQSVHFHTHLGTLLTWDLCGDAPQPASSRVPNAAFACWRAQVQLQSYPLSSWTRVSLVCRVKVPSLCPWVSGLTPCWSLTRHVLSVVPFTSQPPGGLILRNWLQCPRPSGGPSSPEAQTPSCYWATLSPSSWSS